MSAKIHADGGNLSVDRFLFFVVFSTTRVRAFDAVSKGCCIPSTFAVRVLLFWQHHGEQVAVVIVDRGRIDRGAYCQEKGELVVSTRGS